MKKYDFRPKFEKFTKLAAFAGRCKAYQSKISLKIIIFLPIFDWRTLYRTAKIINFLNFSQFWPKPHFRHDSDSFCYMVSFFSLDSALKNDTMWSKIDQHGK